MNKKEILEIRKQFTPANCAITRICGCYVDHEKEKKMEQKKLFVHCLEEEAFKYFTFLKRIAFRYGREKYIEYGISDRCGDARGNAGVSFEASQQQASG